MLKEYLKLFGDFTKTALSVSRICRYLSRYWIPGKDFSFIAFRVTNGQEILAKHPVISKLEKFIRFAFLISKTNQLTIHQLSLVMWRQHCFDPIKEKLIPALLDLLDEDRRGNKQDKTLVRNMVQSYIEFGKNYFIITIHFIIIPLTL
jgi:hypothetical protein